MRVVLRIFYVLFLISLFFLLAGMERVIGIPLLSFCFVYLAAVELALPERVAFFICAAVVLSVLFFIPALSSAVIVVGGSWLMQVLEKQTKYTTLAVVLSAVVAVIAVGVQTVLHLSLGVGIYIVVALSLVALSGGKVRSSLRRRKELRVT